MQKPWFKNKTYGWGWQPATWQGGLVMIIWMIVEVCSIWYFYTLFGTSNNFVWWVIGISVVSSTLLVIVAALTGEKPRWQWGEKKQPPTTPSA